MIDPIAESKRCLHCARPACRAACPIGTDIPNVLRLVSLGRNAEAVSQVGHPFGGICGFVCPHERQCQGGCVLGAKGKPVCFGEVERSLFEHAPLLQRRSCLLKGRNVAVVGGGVAGLCYAYKTYEQGADVTVFERDELLSTVKLIPDFRLPRQITDGVVSLFDGKIQLVKRNVDAKCLCDLTAEFDDVFVATGAVEQYSPDVIGEQFFTPYTVFLKNSGDLFRKTVVVVGGGNTAMDCARLAKRSGANVIVAYRRQRADMPAFDREADDAQREGVQFLFNVTPVALRKEARLTMVLAKTLSQGRGKLTVTNDVTEIVCDVAIAALGAKGDDTVLQCAQTLGLTVGGDAAGGKTVAQAVADGLKAANCAVNKLK